MLHSLLGLNNLFRFYCYTIYSVTTLYGMFVQCVNSSLIHFNATDEIPNLIFWEINMLAET